MTDEHIADHVAGVDALLAAGGFTLVADGDPAPTDPQALPVFPGGAPDSVPQQRYAVLWTDSGTWASTKLCTGSDRVDMLVTVVSVGTTREQALWVVDRAFAALLDQTPTVAGRTCGPISHDSSDPLHRDPDPVAPGGAITYEQVDVFKLTSWPA